MRIKIKENGIASVEFVLLLPTILILLLILFHITKMMMTNIDVITESRLVAWRESIGILEKPRIFNPTARFGGKINTSISYTSASNSLIDDIRSEGNKIYDQTNNLTKVLDGHQLGVLISRSQSSYDTGGTIINWKFSVKKKHALVAIPKWTADKLPVGYDNYLKHTLDSKLLFTRMFPCAVSSSTSAASKC